MKTIGIEGIRHRYRGNIRIIAISLLILLWSYTASDKLFSHREFSIQLTRQFLPADSVPFLSYAIPLTEMLAAIFLLIKPTRRAGLLLSVILMTAFTIYVAQAVFGLREKTPCSCGGIFKNMGWDMHLMLNLFLLILSIYALLKTKKKGGSPENN